MRKYPDLDGNVSCNRLFGRRTLFFCALSFLAGGLIAVNFFTDFWLPLLFAVFFLILYSLFHKVPNAHIALYVGMIFLAMGMMNSWLADLDADFERVSQNCVTGTVCDLDATSSGNVKYKLRHVTAGGAELRHCVYVYADDGTYQLGDILTAEGLIRQPSRKSYPYDFDMRLYCASEDVSVIVYAEFIEKDGEAQGFSAEVDRLRTKIGGKIDQLYGSYSGIAKAMLIGMDSGIDPAEKLAYRNAGISHILCISGLHLSVICGALQWLLKKLRAGKNLRSGILIAALLGYCLMAGGSVSVVRATVMHLSLLVAGISRRRGDLLTALGTAFAFSYLVNPACIFHMGFQLSYGCVFTILCLADFFGKKKFFSALGVSLCGLLATTLLLWNVNYEISSVSLLFNLAAVPVAEVTLIVLLVITVIFCVFGGVTVYLGIVGQIMIAALNQIAAWSELAPWGIDVRGIPGVLLILGFLGIFILSKYFIAGKRVKLCCIAAILAAFTACLLLPRETDGLTIRFLPYAYGDTAVITTEDGKTAVLDAGSPYGADYLRAYGLESDLTLISSGYKRSVGGLEEYDRETVRFPEMLRDGEEIPLSGEVSILPMVSEDGKQADYLVKYRGENILLYLGGSPQKREYPRAEAVKLISDADKNIALAGKVGAKYVILREHTEKIPAIAVNDAGVVSLCCDDNLTVESTYDCGTVPETTEF